MHRKLTITVDEEVYRGLYTTIGRGRISQFIETLARIHVVRLELETAYRLLAGTERRESRELSLDAPSPTATVK